MPMYGQSFSLADNSNHGLNAPTYGGGEAGDYTRARGFLSYYEVRARGPEWRKRGRGGGNRRRGEREERVGGEVRM